MAIRSTPAAPAAPAERAEPAAPAARATTTRRRDRQREETRRDLALAALELASTHGLANVRVPDIAAAAGVSPRTFNNYFPSKEAAIAWPAASRAARVADELLARPPDEPLRDALLAAALALQFQADGDQLREDGVPAKLRALVVREPALYGEFLKATYAGERALADAIRIRTGAGPEALEPSVLAATVVWVHRAAVRHWVQQADKPGPLADTVRAALKLALERIAS